MNPVEVLCYEKGEKCQWLDVDKNMWYEGNLVGDRIFYDYRQVFIVSYWDDDKDELAFVAVKREELQVEM